MRRSPLGDKPMPLARREPIKRTRMKRRRTRIKAGYDPQRRRWLRTLPCACCGRPAPSEVSHERRKGTGLALKSADTRAWPSCRRCHRDYEARRGIFSGMTDEQRQAWTDETCALLAEAYERSFGREAELRQPIAGRRAA